MSLKKPLSKQKQDEYLKWKENKFFDFNFISIIKF